MQAKSRAVPRESHSAERTRRRHTRNKTPNCENAAANAEIRKRPRNVQPSHANPTVRLQFEAATHETANHEFKFVEF
jgi:hypothetical protein